MHAGPDLERAIAERLAGLAAQRGAEVPATAGA
jgi:hypothetical protein